MSRRKQFRRRAELPMPPHVVAALRKMRHSLGVLNSLFLPSDMPVDSRLMCVGPVAFEFQKDVINFVSALLCWLPSLSDDLPPCTTLTPQQVKEN